MKKAFLVLIILMGASSVFAQAGLLDSTFDNDGIVTTNLDTHYDIYQSLAVQDDGKIVAGGYFFSSIDGNAHFTIARYNENGSLDSTFNTDGVATPVLSDESDYLLKIKIYPDQRALAGGMADGHFVIARFKQDGHFDSTFNGNGIVLIDSLQGDKYTSCNGIVILPDETILAEAGSYAGSPAVIKLNADGSLNTSFGLDGVADIENFFLVFHDLSMQADGKILLAGSNSDVEDGDDFAIFRLNADGSPDSSFGTNGLASHDLTGKWDYAYTALTQSDGKIILAGYAGDFDISAEDDSYGILRYNTNGTLDSTFAVDGKWLFRIDDYFETLGFCALLDSSDNIFMSGYYYDTFDTKAVTVKLDPDGNFDPSFGDNGVVITTIPGQYTYVAIYAIAQQADGKILIAGTQVDTLSNDLTFCIIRYLNGNAAVAVTTNEISLNNSLQLKIYPNPTSDVINLRFSLETQSTVEVSLFNWEGRNIRTLTSKIFSKGSYEMNFDLHDLAKGIYLLQFSSSELTSTTKVVKQ